MQCGFVEGLRNLGGVTLTLSREMVSEAIDISKLIVKASLAQRRMPTKADSAKYNKLVRPKLDAYKVRHGDNPRMLLQRLLDEYVATRGIGDDYEAKGIHYWGRTISRHVWAAITRKDKEKAYKEKKVSNYPQLYVLVDPHCVRFGLSYGLYVPDNSEMVTVVKNDQKLQEDILRVLKEDPTLTLYRVDRAITKDWVPSPATRVPAASASDVAREWSSDVQLTKYYEKGSIPVDVEAEITGTLDRLLSVFLRLSLSHEPDAGSPVGQQLSLGRPYWFVGAHWGDAGDQSRRFIDNGIWENGYTDKYLDEVKAIRPGDRIAIKAAYTRKRNLPFDNRGHRVATMVIKAVGVVTRNLDDGRRLQVKWTECVPAREWYFYTNLYTIWRVSRDDQYKAALVDFTFSDKPQDYSWFRNDPFWKGRFGDPDVAAEEPPEAHPPYSIDDIVSDGSFMERSELEAILQRLRDKKNLILQGPPGTGKTWLAKRLAFALIGRRDESKVKAIQFHPNLSYEDFVRGLRPSQDGRFENVDGPFLEMVDRALEDRSSNHVVVIEEINRGNPAQILGEMLTLLEADRRSPTEALELSRRKWEDERVFIPPNLYVIGTMNIADRSLALVDFALRRRFAFVDLEPRLGKAWRDWVAENCGIDAVTLIDIERRLSALNAAITADRNLGKKFCIGHSFVTPPKGASIGDGYAWFKQVVRTEIGPLLEEYWFDLPERACDVREEMMAGL